MKGRPFSPLRVLALMGFLLAFLAALLAWDGYRFLFQPLALDHPQLIELPRGGALHTLGKRLRAKGIIRNPRDVVYLSTYGRLRGQSRHLQAGEYQLRPGMSPVDLLHAVVAGKIYQHSLTLVDGWTFKQMMAALNTEPALKHRLGGENKKQIMHAVGHPKKPAEGRFLPNTYYFPKGMTDIAFLHRAYRAMQHALNKQWRKRAKHLPLKNREQALTLASIIEKETGVPSELPRIAGVFIRRLQKGMRLETDPTVIYGLGKSFNGNLTRAELHTDTPYNTYTRDGLPPTPICLPSPAALRAALHPASGKALYFVAKGNGTHHFSATLAEHRRAVRQYQIDQ